MAMIDSMIMELEQESKTTRKLLERIPQDKFSFKPHEKSMSLGRLASHIAESPGWASATIASDDLDLDAMGYTPYEAETLGELLAMFDKCTAEALETMRGTTDEAMMASWRMHKGGQVVMEMPRAAVLRTMILNHGVHHRGQLSVYLRLVDVPIPSIYGPTADEPM